MLVEAMEKLIIPEIKIGSSAHYHGRGDVADFVKAYIGELRGTIKYTAYHDDLSIQFVCAKILEKERVLVANVSPRIDNITMRQLLFAGGQHQSLSVTYGILETNSYTPSGKNGTYPNPIIFLGTPNVSEQDHVRIIYVSNYKSITGCKQHNRPITMYKPEATSSNTQKTKAKSNPKVFPYILAVVGYMYKIVTRKPTHSCPTKPIMRMPDHLMIKELINHSQQFL